MSYFQSSKLLWIVPGSWENYLLSKYSMSLTMNSSLLPVNLIEMFRHLSSSPQSSIKYTAETIFPFLMRFKNEKKPWNNPQKQIHFSQVWSRPYSEREYITFWSYIIFPYLFWYTVWGSNNLIFPIFLFYLSNSWRKLYVYVYIIYTQYVFLYKYYTYIFNCEKW